MTPYRRYLPVALENTPFLLRYLLEGLSEAEIDFRPDPERFTLRESIAHMADFEPIFRERIVRALQEDHPSLPGYNEDELAKANNYGEKNLWEQLDLFEAERTKTVASVKAIPENGWERTAERVGLGTLTVAELAGFMPFHDSYHLKQVVEWRRQFAATSSR